jgi:tetratricopeptide (TPR) repeat protein
MVLVPMNLELFGLADASPPNAAPALLCSHVRTPSLPCTMPIDGALPVLWFQSNTSLEHLAFADASTLELADQQVAENSPSLTAEHLFLSAHRLMAAGKFALADRCLQKALQLHSATPSNSAQNRPSIAWLVLATSALLKQDLDSCETWLKQAERTMHGKDLNVESPEFQRAAGDLFAIKACLIAQTRNRTKAETFLTHALACHIKAGANFSTAQDLILQARLRLLDRNLREAELLLAQAEMTLERCLDTSLSDVERLRQAIQSDRQVISSRQRVLMVAESN